MAGGGSDIGFAVRGWLAAAVAIAAFGAFATAAHAVNHKAQFTVSYSGGGVYTGRTADHTGLLNRRCDESTTERTMFSYNGVGVLRVRFDRDGMTGDSYTLTSGSGDWVKSGRASTALTKSTSGPGCRGLDGVDRSGAYNCNTELVVPHSRGISKFALTKARRGGRSKLRAIGPADFSPKKLTGSWTYKKGSCSGLNGMPLLQTMTKQVPPALTVSMSIPERKLRNLHVRDYMLVNVGEGEHAPTVNDVKQCDAISGLDSCSQRFGWAGTLVVRRVS
jgi:hypothetical protein